MKKLSQSLRPVQSIKIFALLLTVLLFCSASPAGAEVTLPSIFGDRMVLQRDKPVKVWGWAQAGERVTVGFGDQSVAAQADAEGKWIATLPPMAASFEGRELTVAGRHNQIKLSDVLVGEVWVCGGQSNMEWTMRSTRDADIEIDSADYDAIRFISFPNIASPKPLADMPATDVTAWQKAVTGEVENCTGVGFYFAKRLHRRLKVPVGIIDNAWGGTTANHWCAMPTLEKIPEMKAEIAAFNAIAKAWVDGGGEAGAKKRYEADLAAWEAEHGNSRRTSGRPNARNYTDPRTGRQPAGMFNALVAPLSNYAIRGVLFYQGENNSFGESWKPFYATFPGLIADWRTNFGEPDLPFGIIQIAGWSTRRSMTYDQNHHTNVIREIQHKVWQQTPNTGLIVTYDTNSSGNIHPGRKQPVGERSARWALAEVYNVKQPRSNTPIEWRGPVYEGYKIAGDKIVVTFGKETARGLRLNKDLVAGFYIAGKDKVFHHAQASVNATDASVTVWAEAVSEPAAVRYAISNLPMGTLMNGRELPAYPFRTDTWPITPHQSTGQYRVDLPIPVVGDAAE